MRSNLGIFLSVSILNGHDVRLPPTILSWECGATLGFHYFVTRILSSPIKVVTTQSMYDIPATGGRVTQTFCLYDIYGLKGLRVRKENNLPIGLRAGSGKCHRLRQRLRWINNCDIRLLLLIPIMVAVAFGALCMICGRHLCQFTILLYRYLARMPCRSLGLYRATT